MRKRNVLLICLMFCAAFIGGCGQPEAHEEFYLGPASQKEDTVEVIWPAALIDMQVIEVETGDFNVHFLDHDIDAVDDTGLYARIRFAEDDEGAAHNECTDALINKILEHEDEGLFSSVAKNKDGTITVSMTGDEYANSVKMVHNGFTEAVETFRDTTPFVDIEYEPDFSEIRFYAGNEGFSMENELTIWSGFYKVIHNAAMLRLYESQDGGKALVRILVFDHDSGQLFDETIVPGGELVLPLNFER